ncbi:uncharacterized protein LOC127870744 isoform X2 [Dreissena polymorpha]|uniref:uncharacterized protein LOC127870744 isoform X2 n=1 Tax=Dreissena polymorpha TaxID=45954 RepID=UPI0022650F2D|nr:uncharacterized protein LOC127870744 isoform X2 [Dreissena polymorpha]
MADYKDIIRKPETVNWFKAAMGLNITSDCLLVIVKGIAQIYYDNIRQEIKQQNGIPENVVCNQCNTPNVVLCDPQNKCCNRGRCTFHEIHKPRNCPINNLCHEIRQQIAKQHRFCNPTWINTDASKWCTDPWHIAKCFLPKDGYKDVNQAEDTDFNGLVNVIYNCEYYESYFNNDLTDKENVCTKAREVGRTVRHKTTMSMTSQDSNSAIDTLVALLQSLKHADHQAASRTTVDKLTQLKNGTLVITDEDIAITFEHFKETLTREIKDVLQEEKNSLVNVMADALKITGKNITEEIIHTGDGQIERINSQIDRIERTGDEVMNKIDNTFTKAKSSNGDETTRPTVENRNCLSSICRSLRLCCGCRLTGDEPTSLLTSEHINVTIKYERNSALIKIQKWLIKQYQSMCVVPISMLDSGIDVPLSRIYVTPSISELKRGQNGGRKALPSSSGDRDLSSYKELLHRDGKEVITVESRVTLVRWLRML